MIEYAGLNPMGNKARAGCPVKNIQQTLDQLTNAGLVVAVYEEINIGKDHLDLKKVSFVIVLLNTIFVGKNQTPYSFPSCVTGFSNIHL